MPDVRLIDANALCDVLDEGAYVQVYNSAGDAVGRKPMPIEFKRFIDAQPTIDAVPVKRACWTENKYGEIVCSRCGEYAQIDYDDYSFRHKVRVNYSDYCSNCGADMRGKLKETEENQ